MWCGGIYIEWRGMERMGSSHNLHLNVEQKGILHFISSIILSACSTQARYRLDLSFTEFWNLEMPLMHPHDTYDLLLESYLVEILFNCIALSIRLFIQLFKNIHRFIGGEAFKIVILQLIHGYFIKRRAPISGHMYV